MPVSVFNTELDGTHSLIGYNAPSYIHNFKEQTIATRSQKEYGAKNSVVCHPKPPSRFQKMQAGVY